MRTNRITSVHRLYGQTSTPKYLISQLGVVIRMHRDGVVNDARRLTAGGGGGRSTGGRLDYPRNNWSNGLNYGSEP